MIANAKPLLCVIDIGYTSSFIMVYGALFLSFLIAIFKRSIATFFAIHNFAANLPAKNSFFFEFVLYFSY